MWNNGIQTLRDDAEFGALSRGVDVAFTLVSDGDVLTVHLADGKLLDAEPGQVDFSLHGTDGTWQRLLDPVPEPQWQSVLSCLLRGDLDLTGSRKVLEQHLQIVRRTHEVLRRTSSADEPVPPPPPLQGSYHRIEHSTYGTCDVFVERAGSGIPVLCVPTAGSDTTQFHGLAGCLPEGIELICLDLPWHGKSQPAWGRTGTDYSLSENDYLETVVRVAKALNLDRPVILGASMAGAAAVRAVIRYPEVFRGAIAAQTCVQVGNRTAPWFDAVDVNQNIAGAEWTFGAMSPSSPKFWRDRVWWGYTSGGYSIYPADIKSYVTWDLSNELSTLDEAGPPIILLGGAYDTTVPPEKVKDLADRIPNADFILMEDLGHFPHAEAPRSFARYLQEALQRLSIRGS